MERLENVADRELIRAYNTAITDIRAEMLRIYEQFQVEGGLTRAQASRFLRQSQLEQRIYETVRPTLLRNTDFLQRASSVAFEESFYRHAWAVAQQAGVDMQFGLLSDDAVRAAVGLSGDTQVLSGLMSAQEITRHAGVLEDAFVNYQGDLRRWLSEDITQGVIRGESVPKIMRRLRESGVAKSYNQAQTIARTETLRSTGLGAQISYAQARDLGVNVAEIWDATLDSRTRPNHAALDGQRKDTPDGWRAIGQIVPGPRRSGVASFDINCRCTVRPQTDGYAPSVRRIRDEEGLQPYQTFAEWARRKGITRNRYGQEFDFLNQ
jgi:SPP1 gp7 family putative phage head morphogenesis protein